MRLTRRAVYFAPCLLALGGIATSAHGAAFQLQEQSASLLASAFAGRSADAGDISHMFFNPATLGVHAGRGPEAELVLSYIDPTFDFEADSDPGWSAVGGDTGQLSASGGESALAPVFYAGFDLAPDLRAGLGINVPYGLETDYPEDWVGRYDAVNTDLVTVDINPQLGWRLDEQLALGLGVSAQYADATLSTMAPETDFSTTPATPTPTPTPANDGKLTVDGDSWSYSFNLGAHYAVTEDTQLGVAYRHGLGHTLSGEAELVDDGGVTVDETGGEADLDIPASLNLGVSHQLDPQWTLLADATWTQWSDFEELAIEFDDGIVGIPQGQNSYAVTDEQAYEEYDWDDTWFLSLGTRYDASEQWDLRAGLAYDQTPTGDSNRTPRIPDEDRTWLAVGGTWSPAQADQLRVDFGYTYIWLDDADIEVAEDFGGVTGEYESNVQVFTTSANWRF
ncbi:OmpP1/FadL family transporter [Halorhodospira halophila]|uniref:Membrane protein involved in aromatic hydrocarbon degradation n=1 Tax=Halorhodospira halophila (strain DSM 244 / SL1) TaxID=349124 RepID=A1WWT4_HALHL|nr:outer membrane protein transport protein [Halorhodospira halophila]ABM62146.1 membrane protein involved in aromatic hydrocarbon degradation [Halorhodospira halophila SL1]MBK1729474.1 transporter [Halorhodospira halophila]